MSIKQNHQRPPHYLDILSVVAKLGFYQNIYDSDADFPIPTFHANDSLSRI